MSPDLYFSTLSIILLGLTSSIFLSMIFYGFVEVLQSVALCCQYLGEIDRDIEKCTILPKTKAVSRLQILNGDVWEAYDDKMKPSFTVITIDPDDLDLLTLKERALLKSQDSDRDMSKKNDFSADRVTYRLCGCGHVYKKPPPCIV